MGCCRVRINRAGLTEARVLTLIIRPPAPLTGRSRHRNKIRIEFRDPGRVLGIESRPLVSDKAGSIFELGGSNPKQGIVYRLFSSLKSQRIKWEYQPPVVSG